MLAVAPSAPGLAPSDAIDGVPVTRFRYAPERLETLAYGGTMIAEAKRTAGLAMLAFLAAARAATAKAIRVHRPNVVHAHWWFPGGLAAASASRLPLVTTMHGTDVRIAVESAVARPALRWVLSRSRACTTVSTWLAERIREMAPAAEPIVAPMPAAVELFTPDGTRDAGLVLFVGRFNEQKGARNLLEAFARLPASSKLRLIGAGPDEPALRAQASRLGIAPRIEWRAPVPQHELPNEYRQAAVVAVPSVEEGLGMVAVEAQLCGAAVVASASGGLPDVVQDGRTGLLVPPNDSQAMALALRSLLDDPERARELGAAGRAAALGRFSPDAVADGYISIYRQAASDP